MRTRIAVATVLAGVAALPMFGLGPEYVGSAAGVQKPTGRTSFATLVNLPSLGSNAEAHGINDAGTVIVGHSFDRAGYLYAVKWTSQNGVWVISTLPNTLPNTLPYPGSAVARGIDDHGNIVGYGATAPRRPVYWPAAGGSTVLGCDGEVAETWAISANGQVVVGQGAGRAMAWQPPASCTETLPPLEAGGTAWAFAVSGDGGIIGGHASLTSEQNSVPVRWILTDGQRQVEQLDSRARTVRGANASGDLAGYVTVPCTQAGGCVRSIIMVRGGWFLRSRHAGRKGELGSRHQRVGGGCRAEQLSERNQYRVLLVPGEGHVAASGQSLGQRQCPQQCADGWHSPRRWHRLAGERGRVGREEPLTSTHGPRT